MRFVDGDVVRSWRLDVGVNLATVLRFAPGMMARKPDYRGESSVRIFQIGRDPALRMAIDRLKTCWASALRP
jgi:hypothetical protein